MVSLEVLVVSHRYRIVLDPAVEAPVLPVPDVFSGEGAATGAAGAAPGGLAARADGQPAPGLLGRERVAAVGAGRLGGHY